MTQAMARSGQQQLAQPAGRELDIETVCEMTGYTPLELALISKTVAVGAPLLELAQFAHACKQLHLDPLLRQAYWIRRKGREQVNGEWRDVYKGALQIGIDGFRALADGHGNYAGSSEPVFRGLIEWTYKGKKMLVPEYCQVTVRKIVQGHVASFVGEARWVEYVPEVDGATSQSSMWAKMPRNQLAKCAEAQAIRKGWALQAAGVTFSPEAGTPDGDLPEVAAPAVTVQEQPRPKTQQQLSADYQRIYASNYDDAPEPEPDEPEPDAKRQAPSEELVANRKLVGEARAYGMTGLGSLTANDTWPVDKVAEANAKLRDKIAKRSGDADTAAAQDAVL